MDKGLAATIHQHSHDATTWWKNSEYHNKGPHGEHGPLHKMFHKKKKKLFSLDFYQASEKQAQK